MTGVEAVSNGVQAFKEPVVSSARRTLAIIVAILILVLLGVAYLVSAYGITAAEPGTTNYQSILSLISAAVVRRGPFYFVTLGAILLVLSLQPPSDMIAIVPVETANALVQKALQTRES